MARPRRYKHPPQGTLSVFKVPLVSKTEHEKAVFANRLLHEIGDEELWTFREALRLDKKDDPVVNELRAKLRARYTKGKRRIGLYTIDWKFVCQLISWS